MVNNGTMEPLKTHPITPSHRGADRAEAAFLIRIGQSHRLLEPAPLMVDLRAAGEVFLGRGEEERILDEGTTRRLLLADPCMSGRHARVFRLRVSGRDQYHLEDRGSTNGCQVNGRRVAKHPLRHGDILETGQTFWRLYQAPVRRCEQVLELAHQGGPVGPTSSVSLDLLQELLNVGRIAASEIPIILGGESGTGKEVMSNEVHRMSERQGPFVALNCAAIPEGLIESELFGHRKGAFTGAVADKQGVVEQAHGGTLLLDEIGDMPLPVQAKLLRLLQERSFVRLGETRERRVDIRFIAATHRDLRGMVAAETFRGDLYSRLNGYAMNLPPLRARVEDLGLLLAVFLGRCADAEVRMDQEVLRALLLYDWPFNIRELEKAVESSVALARGQEAITLADLPEPIQQVVDDPATDSGAGEAASPVAEGRRKPRPSPGDDQLRAALVEALQQHQGNVSAVARQMDTTRMQIHRWMKRLDLDAADYRGG